MIVHQLFAEIMSWFFLVKQNKTFTYFYEVCNYVGIRNI